MAFKLNCKKVSEEILTMVEKKIKSQAIRPEVNILLTLNKDNNPLKESQVYVEKKTKIFEKLGIKSNLHHVKSYMSKQDILDLIDRLNKDPSSNGIFVQLPFVFQTNYAIEDIINKIHHLKDVDGLNRYSAGILYTNDPNGLKPATPLGICALLSYYDIQTKGKNVVIIGKGKLSGKPLSQMLMSHPFNSSVTICDIYTPDLKHFTSKADILISACGRPHMIKPEMIKDKSILIDVGISVDRNSSKPIIRGDINPSCYARSKFYTTVPGGVGLLTTSTLAHNVMNATLIQQNMKPLNLNEEMFKRDKYIQFVNSNATNILRGHKILLFSSSYNGMSQNIERVLKGLGHQVHFEVAKTDEQMRHVVNKIKPDLIICPFLKKAIPSDIYEKTKCLIVHPGIKGDRGPSSLDWAILNKYDEWGVTVLEADKEMDAGNIWASCNFKMPKNFTKGSLYNSLVMSTAEKLVVECLSKFKDPNFVPEPLDYSKADVKGRLHRTIRLADSERAIDWNNDSTVDIIGKSKAADTQPGLRTDLSINDEKVTRFVYGVCNEAYLKPPNGLKNGQIFAKRDDAVCVKTKDGSVWFSCLRSVKTKENPYPIKLPATLQLKNELDFHKIPELNNGSLPSPDFENTYQEICFEKIGKCGILYFNFYNGAMDTRKCRQLVNALKQCSSENLNVLIIAGSETNWSNGIHLNVIENAQNSAQESWENIKAINNVVKEIISLKDLMTISAVQANAGAGGVYLSMASDFVFAKPVVFNPHYKNMGLFGSELHTLTASKRIGKSMLDQLKESAIPIITKEAIEINLIDDLNSKIEHENRDLSFMDKVKLFATRYSNNENKLGRFFGIKNETYDSTKLLKIMLEYEEKELEEMYLDMFMDRNGFEMKRKAFVRKLDVSDLQKSV